MADFLIAQGDTHPDLVVECKNGDGTVQDLTGATVRFVMWNRSSNAQKLDVVATIDSPATNGKARYQLTATDSDTPGVYHARMKVTLSSGRIVHYPNGIPLIIEIARRGRTA